MERMKKKTKGKRERGREGDREEEEKKGKEGRKGGSPRLMRVQSVPLQGHMASTQQITSIMEVWESKGDDRFSVPLDHYRAC